MSSTTLSDPTSMPPRDRRSGEGIIHQFFDALAANWRGFAVFGVLALSICAVAVFFSVRNDEKADAAANALFIAQKKVSQELKTLADAAPKPSATGKKAAPGPAANEASVRFERFDVDQKLPESVKSLRAIATGEYQNTRAAYEARLVLGNLYFDHGDAAKAAVEFDAAVRAAPVSHEKAMAWMALGHAQENLGKLNDALASYLKAQTAADTDPARAEALLSQARVQALLKDTVKAKATYDQVSKLLPGSEYARTAESLKARFE